MLEMFFSFQCAINDKNRWLNKKIRKKRLNSPKLRQFPSLCPGDWKAPGCASWFKDPAVGGVGEERDAAAEGDDGQEHEGGDQDSCHTGRTAPQQG